MLSITVRFHAGVKIFETALFYLRNLGLLGFLLKNRAIPNHVLFRAAWLRIRKHGVRHFRKQNLFGIPQIKFLHHEFRYYFKQLFRNYSPEILKLDPNLVVALKGKPTVIAIDHSKCEYALCAALDAAGLQSAMITHDPFFLNEINNYKFQKKPINILKSAGAFVAARAAMKNGAILIIYVDYLSNNERLYSPAVFEFQNASKAQLFFAKIEICEEGQMKCILKQSVVSDDHRTDYQTTMQEFQKFSANDLTYSM